MSYIQQTGTNPSGFYTGPQKPSIKDDLIKSLGIRTSGFTKFFDKGFDNSRYLSQDHSGVILKFDSRYLSSDLEINNPQQGAGTFTGRIGKYSFELDREGNLTVTHNGQTENISCKELGFNLYDEINEYITGNPYKIKERTADIRPPFEIAHVDPDSIVPEIKEPQVLQQDTVKEPAPKTKSIFSPIKEFFGKAKEFIAKKAKYYIDLNPIDGDFSLFGIITFNKKDPSTGKKTLLGSNILGMMFGLGGFLLPEARVVEDNGHKKLQLAWLFGEIRIELSNLKARLAFFEDDSKNPKA